MLLCSLLEFMVITRDSLIALIVGRKPQAVDSLLDMSGYGDRLGTFRSAENAVQ